MVIKLAMHSQNIFFNNDLMQPTYQHICQIIDLQDGWKNTMQLEFEHEHRHDQIIYSTVLYCNAVFLQANMCVNNGGPTTQHSCETW